MYSIHMYIRVNYLCTHLHRYNCILCNGGNIYSMHLCSCVCSLCPIGSWRTPPPSISNSTSANSGRQSSSSLISSFGREFSLEETPP